MAIDKTNRPQKSAEFIVNEALGDLREQIDALSADAQLKLYRRLSNVKWIDFDDGKGPIDVSSQSESQ